MVKGFKTDLSLNEIIENAIIDRGYNSPKLLNSEKVRYNNRDFLNIYYKAYQNNSPVMMSNFMTFHKDYLYFFQFVSNQSTSITNWKNEIEKSMSNLFIHKFITEKN